MMVMTAVASFAMAVALAAVAHERREGIGLWALALVLYGSGYALLALRGQVPSWASVVLANVLMSSALSINLAALEQFQGRPPPWRRMVLPVLVLAPALVVYAEDFQMRVVAVGIAVPLQAALLLHALWRPAPQMRGALLLTAGLVLHIVMFAWRGWLAASGRAQITSLLQPGFLQSVSLVLAFFVVITMALGFILMAKERSDAAQRHMAMHDGLTGLLNRRALMQALERDLAQAARSGQAYALLLLDIDRFKAVNDTRGHLAGDQVLRHVSARLQASLRAQDVVGRYGGEEFMALLPGTGAEGARRLAEALRQAIEQAACPWEGGAIRVTISIGVGANPAGDGTPQAAMALIAAADRALYAAKEGGRNRVVHEPG